MNIKINLNGVTMPYAIFCGGADVCSNLTLDYTNWPEYVLAGEIDNQTEYETHMTSLFSEFSANGNDVTFEVLP